MALRYLRRPAKPALRKAKLVSRKPDADSAVAATVKLSASERVALAPACFCGACGSEHASGGVRDCDAARAEPKWVAVIRQTPP